MTTMLSSCSEVIRQTIYHILEVNVNALSSFYVKANRLDEIEKIFYETFCLASLYVDKFSRS